MLHLRTSITRVQASRFHTCTFWKCRCEFNGQLRDQAREYEERMEGRRREFRKTLYGYRDQVAANEGVQDADQFEPVCVPSYSMELVPVSERRRERFRDHLIELIRQAVELKSATHEATYDETDASSERKVRMKPMTGNCRRRVPLKPRCRFCRPTHAPHVAVIAVAAEPKRHTFHRKRSAPASMSIRTLTT